MTEMTGGQALIRSIHREGVRMIFGLPGVQLYHALDPITEFPDLRFITTRHEQATTYMADGYARASGDVGAAMMVPGPGLQNASAGIGNAYAASSPVLVISGQINRKDIGKGIGILHEINDQLEIVRPITKWSVRVLEAKDIPGAVHECFVQLRTGRPRPVEIEIPPETLADMAEIELMEPDKFPASPVDLIAVQKAVEILSCAKRPVIWAGGGVHSSRAWQELLEVAEFMQAPVITTAEGKGAISDRHYLSIGVSRGLSPGQVVDSLRKYFMSCDVTLAVGTRFATAWPPEDQKVLQIDIDEDEIGRNHSNTTGIVGDARVALNQLLAGLRSSGKLRPSVQMDSESIRADRLDPSKQIEPLGSYLRVLRDSLPDDGVLVPDITQVGYYSRAYYPVYQPRTYFTSSYAGNLGFAYPTALGIKVAKPDLPVVSVSGDGGFLFNSQEMATAAQYNIATIAIVFNDNAYGNVLRGQKAIFDGRTVGAELKNPDFMKLAEAYGISGFRVNGPEELGSVLRKAIDRDEPAVIEVPFSPTPSPI